MLKKDSPEEWYSGPTGDYWIAFKPADPNAIGGLIMDRYCIYVFLSVFISYTRVFVNFVLCVCVYA